MCLQDTVSWSHAVNYRVRGDNPSRSINSVTHSLIMYFAGKNQVLVLQKANGTYYVPQVVNSSTTPSPTSRGQPPTSPVIRANKQIIMPGQVPVNSKNLVVTKVRGAVNPLGTVVGADGDGPETKTIYLNSAVVSGGSQNTERSIQTVAGLATTSGS